MRSRSQDPDGDLASALKDIKVRLDGLDRLGQPPSGGPPTSLPEQGLSSIPPQIDLRRRPFPSPSIQDGLLALTKYGIPNQVPSVTPGTYNHSGWTATNNIPESGDADARRPRLPNHYNPGPAPYSPDNPGPEVAGLQPHSTMWLQFKDVVSYRAYRLNNIRANVRDSEYKRIGKNVRRIKNLIPSLENFDGSEPTALLKFLRALKEGFNTLRASEGTAVRTMAFLLRGDLENFYESRSQSATQIKGGSLVNIILFFGRNNDRNVQCIVNGRFGDRMWTYLCISSNFLNRTRSKNIIKELFSALYTVIVNEK